MICFASPGTGPINQTHGIPYPDLANLRAHYNFMDASKMFSNASGTIPAGIGDRIRCIKGVNGKGEVIAGINMTSDSSSPYRRSDGGSFGESGIASFLDTNIYQTNPFTVYVYCERSSTSCLILCNSDNELSTWLNSADTSLYISQGGVYSAPTGNDLISGFAIRGGVFNAASSTSFINSTENVVANLISAPWRIRLGCSNPSFPYTGKIKHIFIYDGAHDLSMRNTVRTYLNALVAGSLKPRRPSRTVPQMTMNLGMGIHYEGDIVVTNNTEWDATRAAHPGFKMTHFFNANVFFIGGDNTAIRNELLANLAPQDENGLHIHTWAAIVAAAGVTFKNTPTYTSSIGIDNGGYTVLLTAYPKADFETLVTFCLDTFQSYGFTRPVSFVAGGWLMDPDRWEALRGAGVLTDCSKTPTTLTAGAFGPYPYLQSQMIAEYAGITPISQPHNISTAEGTLRAVVSSNSTIEYNDPSISYRVWLDNVVDKQNNRSQNQVVFLSTHAYGGNMVNLKPVIDNIHTYCTANEITLNYVTASQAGQL